MAGKPNFFIVGAPKSGTTALYEYLRQHPRIYVSEIKEPHFFATDLGVYPLVQELEDYARLFADSSDEHLRVGEGSVYYLRSAVAIRNIHEFNTDAKIIAMVRNPVDLVHSLHSQLLYWSEESEGNFERAWRLQERRSRGIDLAPGIQEPFLVE